MRAPQRAKAANADPFVQSWAQVSPYVSSVAADPGPRLDWYRKYRGVLVLSDFVVVNAALAATFLFLFAPQDHIEGLGGVSYLVASPVLALVWLAALGLKESRAKRVIGSGLEEYRRVISACVLVFGALAIFSFCFRASVSRALFVTALPLGIVLLLASRWGLRQWLVRLRMEGRALTPALVVGTAATVLGVVRDTRRNPAAGFQVAGACVLGELSAAEDLELGSLRIVDRSHLAREVRRNRYRAVIVADGLTRDESRDLAWRLENRPIELMFLPRVMDVAGPRMTTTDAEGLSLVHVDLPRFTGWKLVAKRAFDVAFSAMALVLLAPVFLVVAILIKLDDGGPVFFRQQRVGRFGEPFTIHKFRTMCVDAEAKIDALIAAKGGTALLFKLEDDPRITRIGNVLRKYSIDELPQFWSVLRGGMSVVGPRPQVAREVAEYTDVHHRRLLIKPGITGLWQVNGRSELSMEESIRLDLRYVENWSLIGDVIVILKTVGVVLRPSGAF